MLASPTLPTGGPIPRALPLHHRPPKDAAAGRRAFIAGQESESAGQSTYTTRPVRQDTDAVVVGAVRPGVP